MASAAGRDPESDPSGFVTPQCIGLCGGGVCSDDLWRRRYGGVCRRGVGVRRSYIGVGAGGVSASDLWRRCGYRFLLVVIFLAQKCLEAHQEA